jgi:hypothetical protein
MYESDKPSIKLKGGLSCKRCVIDLRRNGTLSRNLEFEVGGPAGTRVKLELAFEREADGGQRFRGRRDKAFVGEFKPAELVLAGNGKKDLVKYCPGLNSFPGTILGCAAFFLDTGQASQDFSLEIRDDLPGITCGGLKPELVVVRLDDTIAQKTFRQSSAEFFEFSGPAGCRVELQMTWDGTAYGHGHGAGTDNPSATGYFEKFDNLRRSQFTLPGVGRKVRVKYVTYGLCGKVRVNAVFRDKLNVEVGKQSFAIEVRYDSLQELPAADYYKLVDNSERGRDNCHLAFHYGAPGLIAAIQGLARAFFEQFAGQRDTEGNPAKLHINDMSLQYGGRLDCDSINHPFQKPHATHMFGNNVDIRSNNLTLVQKDWITKKAPEFGLTASLEYKETTKEHWHCTLVK